MLMPKRVKWRKQMRGRMRGKALRGAEVSFGEYGLMALEPGWITARQIEAARRVIVREMKRRGKVWIRIFPAKAYTHRPPETRMGSGKGASGVLRRRGAPGPHHVRGRRSSGRAGAGGSARRTVQVPHQDQGRQRAAPRGRVRS